MRDAANAVHSPRSTRSNQMRRLLQICVSCVPVALSLSGMCLAQVDAPPPLTGLTVADKAGDDGRALIVHWDATTPPMQVWVSRSLGDDERKSLVRDARVDAAAKAIATGASQAEAEAARKNARNYCKAGHCRRPRLGFATKVVAPLVQ